MTTRLHLPIMPNRDESNSWAQINSSRLDLINEYPMEILVQQNNEEEMRGMPATYEAIPVRWDKNTEIVSRRNSLERSRKSSQSVCYTTNTNSGDSSGHEIMQAIDELYNYSSISYKQKNVLNIDTLEKAFRFIDSELMKIRHTKEIPQDITETIEKVFCGRTITIDALTEALQAILYEILKGEK